MHWYSSFRGLCPCTPTGGTASILPSPPPIARSSGCATGAKHSILACNKNNQNCDTPNNSPERYLSLSQLIQNTIIVIKQVAAVLTAKGRIAAAIYRITLAYAGYFLYFTMGLEMSPPPLNCGFPWGIQTPTHMCFDNNFRTKWIITQIFDMLAGLTLYASEWRTCFFSY